MPEPKNPEINCDTCVYAARNGGGSASWGNVVCMAEGCNDDYSEWQHKCEGCKNSPENSHAPKCGSCKNYSTWNV